MFEAKSQDFFNDLLEEALLTAEGERDMLRSGWEKRMKTLDIRANRQSRNRRAFLMQATGADPGGDDFTKLRRGIAKRVDEAEQAEQAERKRKASR